MVPGPVGDLGMDLRRRGQLKGSAAAVLLLGAILGLSNVHS